MKIIEYTLKITSDEQVIDMPKHARILTVQLQYNEIVFWAIVDEDTPGQPRTFVLRTAGDEIGIHDNYIGTVQTHLVKVTYHLFQVHNI